MTADHPSGLSTWRLLAALFPQLLAVSVMFLLTGAAFAAVPLFISQDLGFGPAVIGLLTGLSFLFAIFTRIWAGGFSDKRGPKPVILAGLSLATLAGLSSSAANFLQSTEVLAIFVLALGRVLLGVAEGIVMVAAQTWALAVAGPRRPGLVIGWIGTAMFTAMALGAPAGGILYEWAGFGSIGLAMMLVPLPMLAMLWRLPASQATTGEAIVIFDVVRRVAVHCAAMALVGISYGAIISFSVLLFAEQGWEPTWAGLTLFSVGLVVARVFGGSAPDRFGGVRTAIWSLCLMVFGLGLMGFVTHPTGGYVGAGLAGLGYALVYPAIAREMLAGVPGRNRGSAMALLASTVSLILGVGGPLMGLMAEVCGTGSVFVLSAVMATVSIGVILRFRQPAAG